MDTKTDRELIELAAKSAGYSVRWNEAWSCFAHTIPINTTNPPTLSGLRHAFTPLCDDGDAFRLMTASGLTPHFYSDHGTTLIVVDDVKDPEGYDVLVKWNGDMAAATRRAIVMAAAKIGEGMR